MKFRCDCGQTLNASESLVGETIQCSGCRTNVQVPAPEELAAKAEKIKLAKEKRKKAKTKNDSPSGVAAVFHQIGDVCAELMDNHRTLLLRGGGFIFGPLFLLVFAAVYFKPIAITPERVEKIQLGMTLKQVEAIIGHTHKRYRDPRVKEVHVFSTRALVDYSRDRRAVDKSEPNARLWHDGWFVTGNNATRSVFVSFEGDVVSDVIWKELDGEVAKTHFPLGKDTVFWIDGGAGRKVPLIIHPRHGR